MIETVAEQDIYWMQLALQQAQIAAEQDEVPVGAVIVKDQQLIAAAHNQPITLQDATAHAEILALRKASKKIGNYRLVNTRMYVTLEPCCMCASALVHARIQHVVFGAFDQKTGAVQSVLKILDHTSMNHKVIWQGGVLQEQCGQLLSDFFKKKRIKNENKYRENDKW